jgi:hypothetical protein
VGRVSTDAAGQGGEAVDLVSVCQGNPPLARMIRTECPGPGTVLEADHEAAEAEVAKPIDKSSF